MRTDSGYNMHAAPWAEIICPNTLAARAKCRGRLRRRRQYGELRISRRQVGGRLVSGHTRLGNGVNARGYSIQTGEQQGNTLLLRGSGKGKRTTMGSSGSGRPRSRPGAAERFTFQLQATAEDTTSWPLSELPTRTTAQEQWTNSTANLIIPSVHAL